MWLDIVESKRSGTVLYLFFSTPYLCIADIVEIPTRHTGEFEYNPIAGLIGLIETGSIGGASLGVVTEASGRSTLRQKRQTKACQHGSQKASIQGIHNNFP
jgi:hypothetical protein